MPQPIMVRAGPSGVPWAVQVRRGAPWTSLASIFDHWLADDEWWRERPVVRAYWEALLQDGRRIVVFRDELDGRWCRIRT